MNSKDPAEMHHKVVIIQGPTCAGKTQVALALAGRFAGEIINADSMQFYRFMDIGTSKPDPSQMQQVPHHLFSIVPPDRRFTAADFMTLGRNVITEIVRRKSLPLVVGGTGLYLKALTQGVFEAPHPDEELRRKLHAMPSDERHKALRDLDPEAAERIAVNDTVRVVRALEICYNTGKPISWHHRKHRFEDRPFQCCKICIIRERQSLYSRIEKRVDTMMENGFVEEVRGLLDRGFAPELPTMRSIGYKEITAFLQGRLSQEEAAARIKTNTKRYAKRQLTWFRKDTDCRRVTLPDEAERVYGIVEKFLKT